MLRAVRTWRPAFVPVYISIYRSHFWETHNRLVWKKTKRNFQGHQKIPANGIYVSHIERPCFPKGSKYLRFQTSRITFNL
ncbi:hypothetical protein scyTo_0014816 [Scyliorhinus torazame]|uniref:Uncharacterized protein n=1 Tax=Scyliorhinus torazame TaxID=75743 RepID=A0A401NVC6_SCYTO|nr:hypothetical protein [Scyliorhinus torazame]